MTSHTKTLEQKLRRTLNKYGYSLRKSRRPISADNFGDYMIVNQAYNAVVAGPRYELNLEDVANWLKE